MKPEYNQVYSEMLDQYPFGPGGYFSRHYRGWIDYRFDATFQTISHFVEEVCQENKVVLRADARFFLILNFHQMIAVPVTIVRGTQSRQELLEAIREDIQLIITSAAKQSEKEVSGGTIIHTVAAYWQKLRTNAQQIWS